MKRIAIIGAGISGLASGYLLSREYEVTLFEREPRLGGHTHTVSVAAPEGRISIDTGFIVHNRVNYPNFVRLMHELGVDTCASDMSFAVSWQGGSGFDWCSRGLNGIFANRRNLFHRGFYGFMGEVMRFNRNAPGILDSSEADLTLGEYLRREGHSPAFRDNYLYPMASAVWSMGLAEMDDFPATTLIRFYQNHGFLGISTQHPWRTIPGGTSRYLEPISRPFRDRLRLGVHILSVRRIQGSVEVQVAGGEPERFDEVVFACHGDQVLPMLKDATPLELDVLGAFTTTKNPTWLHRDTSLLPRHRRGWASWNYRVQPDQRLLATYHMNRLQPLQTKTDHFISLHPEGLVDESKVLMKLDYEHPRYNLASVRAQARWADVSGADHIHFAGAHWGNGFHEDGLNSAIKVARSLGVAW